MTNFETYEINKVVRNRIIKCMPTVVYVRNTISILPLKQIFTIVECIFFFFFPVCVVKCFHQNADCMR